jgi:hypothetical protein
MRKSNIVNVLLISVLMLLIVCISVPTLQQNLGGQKNVGLSFLVAAQSQPNVIVVNRYPTGNYGYTNVTVVLQNKENFDVHGTATVTLKTYQNPTGTTKTSDEITIPALQTITTIVPFSRLPFDPAFATFVTFTAQETVPSTPLTSSGTSGSNGFTHTSSTSGRAGFDYGALTLPISAVAVVVLCAIGSVVVLKKRGVSEQKVKRFTSNEFQYWVLQRLQAHEGSVLDSRKGIDGFTGENVPVSIEQSDSVERLQVDIFMNTLMQAKVRSGVMVAFGFSSEANAAVSRARMNRIDIKLVTVKDLIERKETALI